jgi:hypothetical protein
MLTAQSKIQSDLYPPRGDATLKASVAAIQQHIEQYNKNKNMNGKYLSVCDVDLRVPSDYDISVFAVVFSRKQDANAADFPLVREVVNKMDIERSSVDAFFRAVSTYNIMFGAFLQQKFEAVAGNPQDSTYQRILNAAFVDQAIILRGINRFVVKWDGQGTIMPTKQKTNVELQTTGSTQLINTGVTRIFSGKDVYVRVLLEADHPKLKLNPKYNLSPDKRVLETYQITLKPLADIMAMIDPNPDQAVIHALDWYAIVSRKTLICRAMSSADSGEVFRIVMV